MKLNIDLSKVPSLKPVPDGTYLMRLESQELKKSHAQNDKIVFKAKILKPDEQAADPGVFYFDISLAERALFNLKNLAEACGKLKEGMGFETNDLIGCEVGLVLTLETTPEYGTRNRIQQYLQGKLTKPGLAPVKETIVAGPTSPSIVAPGSAGISSAASSEVQAALNRLKG